MTHTPSLVSALSATLAISVLASCAAPQPADNSPIAECPVCRESADLACLHVHIHPDTPRADYAGKTYYFCSSECRDIFLKDPEKYAGR